MSSGRFNSQGFELPNNPAFPFDYNEPASSGPGGSWRDLFPEIIGRSSAMLKVLDIVNRVARTDTAVLLYGESGTGKELIASALHRLSPRSSRRFVPLNCSAIPETLLESELFGYEKGAFTDARARHAGHFEMANGGTVLLDEIGDMPARLQAKLLRVLQEKHFTPVGSSELKKADVRIVAATNVDLQKAVSEGRFRLDLFYRLNVLPISLPPLRERTGDVEPLLDHFLDLSVRKHGVVGPCFFKPDVVGVLKAYPWPGNVRELQNLVERLVVMNAGPIGLEHLPREYRLTKPELAIELTEQPLPEPTFSVGAETMTPRSGLPPMAGHKAGNIQYPKDFGRLPDEGLHLTSFMENLENSLILQALERTEYNKNRAAKLLGLNRTTLVERIKKRKLVPLNIPSKEL